MSRAEPYPTGLVMNPYLLRIVGCPKVITHVTTTALSEVSAALRCAEPGALEGINFVILQAGTLLAIWVLFYSQIQRDMADVFGNVW